MTGSSTSVGAFSVALASRSEGDSQWVHLVPAGTTYGRDGRGPYKLSNPAAVITASRAHAGRRQIPIDYDHAIDLATPNGIAAPAAGWIKGLQARHDGIWGAVDWTPRAAEHLANREFRYLSPVIGTTTDGAITCLLRASLTNNPNLDQLTALASMETDNMDRLSELRAALGLPEEASIDDILAKITELTAARQSATPDPSKYVPIGDFERVVTEVNKLNQGISLQAATIHVNEQIEGGKLLPLLRDWGVRLCSTNKHAFDEFVSKTKGGLQAILTPSIASSVPPDFDNHRTVLSSEEASIASNLGIDTDAYLKTKKARAAAREH